MKRVRAFHYQAFFLLVSLPFLEGCVISSYTAIQREEQTGRYVLTGWQEQPFDGVRGFVMICDYDPQTKTLYVREELPR